MAVLIAENITKFYGSLGVLQNINLAVAQGEMVAIMGPSGAGKSTLLHILATLDQPDSGSLRLGNTDLLTLKHQKLATFRNQQIGFVFQSHHLLPEFTALENVCMPGYIAGGDRQAYERRGRDLLALLQLTDRAQHRPSMLSGGEQQRVAVARALFNNPQVVFADEPSGSLDTKNAASLHTLLLELRETLGQTFVFATHNKDFASMADKTLFIRDGQLV
ncbi:MAG: ABC transporter ATP-binding protein [Bacteroidota bacterium]